MINVLYYKRLLDDHTEEIRSYFKKKDDFAVTILNSTVNFREDLKMYSPRILIIEYGLAIEKNHAILRQISKTFQELYLIVAIPDFMGNISLSNLIVYSGISLFIAQSASVAEFEITFRFVLRHYDMKKRYEESSGKYNAIIDEYTNYRKNLEKKDIKIHELENYIDNIIITDDLTGLYNERYFIITAKTMLEECKRYKDNVCIAYVDIDNKEQIKEVYGEEGVDFIYKETAAIIKRLSRTNDCVGILNNHSYFTIALKKIKVESVRIVVGRMKKNIEDQIFLFKNKQIRITVSIGMASTINYFRNTYDFETLTAQVKIALDNAVKKGRNMLVSYS